MREIVVDSFAGGGGASLGISWAIGRGPDIAINHDAEAIALHKANHPESKHYTEDVFHVDPVKACGGRPVGLMWASPDCKHFSKAKGGKPVSPRVRGLAWVVVRWAAEVRPRMIALENVEEFQEWGPLTKANKPCKVRKGQTFKAWKACLTTGLSPNHPAWSEIRECLGADWPLYDRLMEGLGYEFSSRELRASDYGTPTIRKRLFAIMRCDGQPIVWPEPTHAAPGDLHLRPWRTAAECIDWSIPCPSIFERARPLAENTLKRIARGIKRFVIDNPRPFVVPLTHWGNRRNHDIDEPLPTVTGAHRGEQALVAPVVARIGQTGGNGSYVNSPEDPVTTITTKAEHLLVTPVLAGCGGRAAQSPERPLDKPYQTITAKADGVLIAPTLIQTGYVERDGQAPRAPGLDKPLGTVVAGGTKHAVVAPVLANFHGGRGRKARANRVDEALPTQTVENRFGLVSAFLAKHYGGHETDGAAMAQPVPTVTTKDHSAVVAAHLMHNYTSNTRGGEGDPLKPAKTITAGGQHHALVQSFLMAYHGSEKDGVSPSDPMRTVTTRDRFAVVTVAGVEYFIIDICMRMLVPRELYRAQGFPDSYKIEIEFNGKPLTKTAQVKMCGNSVCPPLARALVAANYSETMAEAVA